ncbi:hypothetical protein ACFP81_14250 [Deinococcus lacus]|uniref:Sensor histidine kinase n=1 Tax=Deinococcus lacus TaxID=392561 RepID=A0ABW1YFC9_9DEIO
MRERLRAMGGELEVSGQAGMRVAAWVPEGAEGARPQAESGVLGHV